MSRQEDFIEAGIKYRFEHGKPMAIGGDNFADVANEMNRCKPFEAGAEYGYQYAVEHPNWISVEDELPEHDGGFSDEVLVYGRMGYSVAQYSYISNCWFGTEFTDDEITHWMPIVPPRKEEDNE